MTNEEIKFFDRLSATWDEDEKKSTPEKIMEILSAVGVGEGMDILDLGTGTGVLVPYLSDMTGGKGSVLAVDLSEGMLGKAREKYGKLGNVRFAKLDFESDDVEGRYDLIFMYCVYPHLHSPRHTLNKLIADNLKPSGRIVIAFPTDETFINNIHNEKKAESDMLPSAPVLAGRIGEWSMDASVLLYDRGRYAVIVRPVQGS